MTRKPAVLKSYYLPFYVDPTKMPWMTYHKDKRWEAAGEKS